VQTSSKIWIACAAVAIAGCATIPVQERTLVNGQGGSIVCKQVGRGIVSGPMGKAAFDSCVQDALAKGYQ